MIFRYKIVYKIARLRRNFPQHTLLYCFSSRKLIQNYLLFTHLHTLYIFWGLLNLPHLDQILVQNPYCYSQFGGTEFESWNIPVLDDTRNV